MPHRWDSKTNLDHLRYLTTAQLRDLLEDEESIWCIVRSSKKLQDLKRQNDVKWASNRRLAERNLSYQPYLKNNKLLLAERYQLLGRVISSLRCKHRELDRRTSLKATQQFLKQKVTHFMDESESLWQNFLEGNLLLVDFVKLFRSSRKFYYKHLTQVEKIQDLSSQTHEQLTTGPASSLGLLPNDLCQPNAVNVFYSLSPVVMLPTTFLPLMRRAVKTSYLPPLNKQDDADLRTPSIPITNPAQSQELQTSWPLRPDCLQQQTDTKDKGQKPSQ